MINGGSVSIEEKNLPSATYTDKEVWRAYINPGFNGTINWVELYIHWTVACGTSRTVTGKWQLRGRGESTWDDLLSISEAAVTTVRYMRSDVIYDAIAGGNTAPWELRLIVSTDGATTMAFQFGTNANLLGAGVPGSLSVRTVGESV